jgi:transposase
MWAKHIEQQRRSGQTQRAYCAEHGLQPRVFRRWAQRVARVSPSGVRASDSAGPSAGTIAENAPLPHPVPEILVRAEPRRRWTEDQKLRLVEETFGAGSSISRVARKYGVHTSVLFRWRRQLAGPPSSRAPAAIRAATFAPVQIVPEQLQLPPPAPHPAPSTAVGPGASGLIEIELANGHRVRVDRDVDAAALRRVLSVLAAA